MLSEPEFLSYRLPTLQDVLLWPREGSPKARTKSGHFSFFPNFLRFLNFRPDQSGYGGNIYSKWKRQFRIGVHGKHKWTGGFHFPGHQGCHMSFQNRILVCTYVLLPFLPVCCSFRQLYMFESFSCLCCPDYNAAECSLTRSHHTCIVALSRHTYISKRLKCNNIWHGKDWPMWILQS